MARLLLRANLRRCIVSQMRMASDELAELGNKGHKEGSVREGEEASRGERVLSEREQDYIKYLCRHHREEIEHHRREIAHLQSSLARHEGELQKLIASRPKLGGLSS